VKAQSKPKKAVLLIVPKMKDMQKPSAPYGKSTKTTPKMPKGKC
jgi:hypothetical protein